MLLCLMSLKVCFIVSVGLFREVNFVQSFDYFTTFIITDLIFTNLTFNSLFKFQY